MLASLDFREGIPADNKYIGPARVSFGSPAGEISGPSTVTLSADGQTSILIEVEQFTIPPEYRGLLMAFVQGAVPNTTNGSITMFGGPERQTIYDVRVEVPEGLLHASRALVGACQLDFTEPGRGTVEVVPLDLQFVAANPEAEEFWCMPLFGALDEFRGCANACWIADRSPYIEFNSKGSRCGVAVRVRQDGSPSAYAFGTIGKRDHQTVGEINELLPWGMIAVLRFACGADVSCPWLELRHSSGRLIRRIHQRYGGCCGEVGSAAFSLINSARPGSGIAEFLRRFFDLEPEERRSLTPILSLVHSGTPGRATVDECISDLAKALDALCKHHGIGRQNLAAGLDAVTRDSVERTVEEAREKLKEIRKQCKNDRRLDHLAIIDKIVSRQANVTGDELDFGIAVASLLQKLNLHDTAAMNAYYAQLPDPCTWEGLLSSIRGEVIHSGGIRINGHPELVSWFELARHLHDLCKRAILRGIRYNGTYSASNVMYKGLYEVDRVSPSTTTAQLGYTVPPKF
jgi:hypothetical protein